MKDKLILITGGSSGIGLDLAKEYSQEGCSIILLARNQARLDDALMQCKDLMDHDTQEFYAFSADVDDQEQLQKVVNTIVTDIGVPDILVLSAGIVQSATLMSQSEEEFSALLHTNVLGSRRVAKLFVSHMIAANKEKEDSNPQNKVMSCHRQICFVGSLGGLIPTYGYSGYGASKFAIIGLAGALRQELSQYNIGVSVLCPPEVDTPMVEKEADHILPQTRFIKDIGGTLNVEVVSRAAFKGILKNDFIIVPGFLAKLSYLQMRLMPSIFLWVMQKLVNLAERFVKKTDKKPLDNAL